MQKGGGRHLLDGVRHLHPLVPGVWRRSCIAAYKGETGRNANSRGVEHLDYLEANEVTSLCSGCTVYIIIKAGEMSNTA